MPPKGGHPHVSGLTVMDAGITAVEQAADPRTGLTVHHLHGLHSLTLHCNAITKISGLGGPACAGLEMLDLSHIPASTAAKSAVYAARANLTGVGVRI